MAEEGRPCPSCASPVPGGAVSCPSCGALSLPGAGNGGADALATRLARALAQRYRVEREVGRGGMAVVFLAQDLRHDRPVALKVLLPDLSRVLGLERFLREIHIAAQLNHPHILTLHDSGEADGLLFYVMPYVEGDSLRRRLARDGPLPVADAVRIAAEVADGLAYAHHRGVVHRDIKPENILLTETHALIADFGIARAVHGMGAGSTITSTGISLGTPNYMSPEQAAADPTLDHRTDLYALGCTLFEALTGRPPYTGSSAQALASRHLRDPVPSARALRHEVPVAVDAAIRRAMAKAADERFQSAEEFAEALGPLPATGGVRLRPARRAPIRWRRAAVGVAGVAAVTVAAALLLRGHGAGPATPAARAPLRVVVRPFEDRTGKGRTAADRVTEALTGLLQPVPALAVTAYAVVAKLADAPLDTLAARYAPDRIVVGSVDAPGDSLRVAAQIVDPRSGRSLGESAVTVPRSAGARAAAGPLSVFVRHRFWSEIDEQERRARVRAAAAWDLLERAGDNADAAEQALAEKLDGQAMRRLDVADSLLREAQRIDGASDLIPIELARLADRRAMFVEYLVQMRPRPPAGLPSPSAERARALAILDAEIARRRGPADAFELRARLKEGLSRVGGGDSLLEAAIADYRSATELDLHRATAWRDLGSALLSASQFSEALLAVGHAFDADVFQLYRPLLLRLRYDAALQDQQYAVAEEACRTGLAEASDDDRVMFEDCELQLWSRTKSDRQTAALAEARADAPVRRDSGTVVVALRQLFAAEVLARAQQAAAAETHIRRAFAGAPDGWLPLLLTEAAYARILLRQPDSAIALVADAVRRDPGSRRFFRSAAWFVPLRTDPRFNAAVERPPTAR